MSRLVRVFQNERLIACIDTYLQMLEKRVGLATDVVQACLARLRIHDTRLRTMDRNERLLTFGHSYKRSISCLIALREHL